jgi:uncharacterized protein HemX
MDNQSGISVLALLIRLVLIALVLIIGGNYYKQYSTKDINNKPAQVENRSSPENSPNEEQRESQSDEQDLAPKNRSVYDHSWIGQ